MSMDAKNMIIDEQLDFLMEGSYFADEGHLETSAQSAGSSSVLRSQMRSELKAKLEKSAQTGEPLRAYIGVDPTRTSLHIGHMVPVSSATSASRARRGRWSEPSRRGGVASARPCNRCPQLRRDRRSVMAASPSASRQFPARKYRGRRPRSLASASR